MRLGALVLTAMAAYVWWSPMATWAQCVALLLAAVLFLALGSAWKRLDKVHATILEMREILDEAKKEQS